MLFKSKKIDIRIIAGILVALFLATGSLYLESSPVSAKYIPKPAPTPRRAKTVRKRANYGEFPHSEKAHQLECNNCHKFPSSNWKTARPEKVAFPDITEYPKHQACVGCHKQQFFKGSPPKICSICHVNPSPRDNPRHPFPNPREVYDLSPKGKKSQSDFVVGFPHAKHIEIVAENREKPVAFIDASFVRTERMGAGEASCSVCHQTMKPTGDSKIEFLTPPPAKLGDGFWLKKGTFKTAPIGHTKCFECHNADMGMLPAPETCSACHHLKPPQPTPDYDAKLAATMIVNDKVMTDSWSRRESSGKFRHEFAAHVDMACSTCHDVVKMNTADPLTKKVAISSCSMCHATPSAADGGALNIEMEARKANPKFQCIKCHVTFGTLAIPPSHTEALTAATGE